MNNSLGIENFDKEGLIIEVSDVSNDAIKVKFKGRIYILNPTEVISPYLEELHNKIVETNKIKEIHVDFKDIDLLNSSGLKTLINWFKKADASHYHYDIKLYYDKNVDWQETSLAMLIELFPSIIKDKIAV